MPDEGNGNPFVGPRPFDRHDGRLFFGRNREVRELLSLVISSRVLLLYAASGAGKTSLLNAGVIPLLEQEESFEVLPPARVRVAQLEDGAGAGGNVYAQGVLANWTRQLGSESESARCTTLAEFLATQPHAVDARGFETPRALVFDQFEELFTVAPEHWKQREPFLRQIGEALEADPLLRVVISMREDYVAQLDPHAPLLPDSLRTRYRLERLGQKAALRAVTGPLETTDRRFAPGVAEALVKDLLTFHVDTGRGAPDKVEGEFVEPVQLQVACHSLWTQLPPDVKEIEPAHLVEFGDVDEVLARFYDGAVHSAATAAHAREGRVRRAIEESFITNVGTRGTAIREADATGEVPNAAVDELESRHVLRAERRAGARWYELTHDRMIGPIRASNRTYRELRRRKRLRWQAAAVAGLLVAVVGAGALIRREQVRAEEVAAAAESDAVAARAALLPRTSGHTFSGHNSYVINAEYLRNGNAIVSSSWDGTARVWQYPKKQAIAVLKPGVELHWASVSPNGKLVATATGLKGIVQIWDLATAKTTAVLRGHTARVASLSFAADGRLVTASEDHTARIWRPLQARQLVRIDAGEELYTAGFDRPGERVVTGGERGEVRIWDAADGKPMAALKGHTAEVQAASFDRSGTRVGTASNDGTGRIWTLTTGGTPVGKPRILKGHRGDVYAIAFNREGTHVVTAGADGTARVWDVATGKTVAVLRGHSGEVFGASFSPDGATVVTSGADTTVRLWSWQEARYVPRVSGAHGSASVRG